MAFVNEYIPEADYDKYDLRRICGEHNEAHPGSMYSRDWTIDRERDVFLIQTWTHREAVFNGWAFYWRGEWVFFEMRPVESKYDRANNACWFRFLVKGLAIREQCDISREELVNDLQAAISASPGGVTYSYSSRSATIEFIEGQARK